MSKLLDKTYLLSLLLLENFDELELKIKRNRKLRRKINQIKKELDIFCDDVFKDCNRDTANYAIEMSKKIYELIEKN